jgi:hypothetical protein
MQPPRSRHGALVIGCLYCWMVTVGLEMPTNPDLTPDSPSALHPCIILLLLSIAFDFNFPGLLFVRTPVSHVGYASIKAVRSRSSFSSDLVMV